jgi:uroporphyrinogen-III synthase
MLTRRGAQVVHGPVMRTTLLEDVDVTLAATRAALDGRIDAVVLSTGLGVRSWLGAIESAGLHGRLLAACADSLVLARGPKARSAALGGGLEVDWQSPDETSAEMLARLAELGVRGSRVVVQLDGGDGLLADEVRGLGAQVIEIPVYRWHPPTDPNPARRLVEATIDGRLDAVTFTCAYAVGNTFSLAPNADDLVAAFERGVAAVAVGPVTATALRRHGLSQVVEPERSRLGSMVQAVVAELSSRHRTLMLGGDRVRLQGSAVLVPGQEAILLTHREAAILDLLVSRGRAVVPKSQLSGDGKDEHAAEAAVGRLRSKLGPFGAGIRAVPRRGYACDITVESATG